MDRFDITKKVGMFGIIGNIFLLIIKSIIGFISRSQAMIADAANSAGDIFASLMTAIGNKIASEPSDKDHNFGHGKAEYIFSLFISLSMMGIALKILYDSICSIVYRNHLVFSWWLISVCVVTIITKLALYIYSKRALKKCNNILLESNVKDHRNDCVVTSFTTISIILTKFNIFWFDGVVGVGISAWIFYTGIKIFVESYNVLMDKSLDEETKNNIYKFVKEHEEIIGIKEIYTVPTGYRYVIVLTILVDGNLETFKSHDIADALQEEIPIQFEEVERVIIHVEPFVKK